MNPQREFQTLSKNDRDVPHWSLARGRWQPAPGGGAGARLALHRELASAQSKFCATV